MYDMLWAPRSEENSLEMTGRQLLKPAEQYPPSLDAGDLGSHPKLSCVAQPDFPDGYPLMITFSGGFDTDHSLDQLLIDDAHVDDDNPYHHEWKNSIGLGQSRSEHYYKEYDLLGTRGLLTVGGFTKASGSDTPTTLDTMEYMFADYGDHSDIANTYQGLPNM